MRTCVGCGARLPAPLLVRLVADGDVVALGRAGSGGRGAWLHADAACVERAVKRKAFARALRRPSVVVDGAALRLLLTGSARKN